MTDPPRHTDTGDDSGTVYDREPTAGIPRWVKVGVIVLAIVALLIVVVLLIGGGHGPRRHGLADGFDGIPSARAAAVRLTPAGSPG